MAAYRPRGGPRRLAASLCVGALLGLGLARCGAEGVPAPASTGEVTTGESYCDSLAGYMPKFLEALRDGRFAGLRDVVRELSVRQDPQGNPVAVLLQTAMRTLKLFTHDPDEAPPDRCVSYNSPTEASPPADAANRMCALRRALDFGVRDENARVAFEQLRPLLVKVLNYIVNEGPGADGSEHYEALDVLQKMALNPTMCPADNLVRLLDAFVVYFGGGPDCAPPPAGLGERCPAFQLLANVRATVEDPAIQQFLTTLQTTTGGNPVQGREAIQVLVTLLAQNVVAMPADAAYFDQMQRTLDNTVYPLLADEKYASLKTRLKELVALLKDFLRPESGRLQPLQGVVACVLAVDKDMLVSGALYDLLSRPGGSTGGGVDLAELLKALSDLAHADPRGVLTGAAHVVLKASAADPVALDAFPQIFAQLLEPANSRRAVPALKVLVESEAVVELVTVLDNLLYGCRPPGTTPPG